MNVEDYINTFGKHHRNERQNYEFRSISTLREFVEVAIKNCTIPDVISSFCSCEKPQTKAGMVGVSNICVKCNMPIEQNDL
jgi:hypothetical protein